MPVATDLQRRTTGDAMARVIMALAVALLAGCAPATVGALRTQSAGKQVFEVDTNYQAVYRTIIERARSCFQAGMITAQMMVQGDLYTDIRSGTISVALHGGLGVDTYLAIDVSAIGENRARVETYYAMNVHETNARAVEEWVRTGSAECTAKARS